MILLQRLHMAAIRVLGLIASGRRKCYNPQACAQLPCGAGELAKRKGGGT